MLEILIPRTTYNKTDWPSMEDRAVDLPVPEFWGIKTDIPAVCINTSTGKWKISKRKLKAITEVRDGDGNVLVNTVDYTKDLANGELTLKTTPLLSASTTYYIVIEGDFTISASNYIKVNGQDSNLYAGGQAFDINGSDVWTGQTADLRFKVYGKDSIDGTEELKVAFNFYDDYYSGDLRAAAAQTKIAQSFTTPSGGSFYITRILLWCRRMGTTTGNIWASIHSDQVGTQVGIKSRNYDVAKMRSGTQQTPISINFPQRDSPSELLVDAEGWYEGANPVMENVSQILEDAAVNVVGVPSGDLDSAAFSALESARTEKICIYQDVQIPFGEFIEKLEAGSLFKFLPTLAGKHGPFIFTSGEPAGTPHLFDEDFIWFKSYRDLSSVRQKFIVRYNRNPYRDAYEEVETTSDVALYQFKNKKTLEIHTYLRESSAATTRASDYKGFFQKPWRWIEFEVKSYLLDKIQSDKVKITRTRGDNSGGTFDAVLFRIFRLVKHQSSGTVECKAVLDTQTY